MKTNILSNMISLQKNSATRFVAIVMALMSIGVGKAWADYIEITTTSLNISGNSYTSNSTGKSIGGVDIKWTDINVNNGVNLKASTGCYWNSSAMPYDIDSIVMTSVGFSGSSPSGITVYGASSAKGTTKTYTTITSTGKKKIDFTNESYKYFYVKNGSSRTAYAASIKIYYTAAACNANPSTANPTISSAFTLTSLTGAVGVSSGTWGAGTNCAWTDYGFVWGTSSSPTIGGSGCNKVQVGTNGSETSWTTGTGHEVQPSGSTSPTSWSVGTTYYVKAYGKNGKAGATFAYSSTAASFTLRSITYNSNGGSTVNTQYVNSGGTYSAPTAPTKTGYTFSKWCTNSTLTTDMNWGSAITENKTLYAKWTANTYQVAFNNNGGSGSMSNETGFTYGVSKALTTCTFTAPAHKYFIGWSTNSSATTATYTDGQSVSNLTSTNNGTVTLYAIWKDHTYTNYRTSCCTPWDDPTWSYSNYSLSVGGSSETKTLSGTTHGTLSFASSNGSVISVNSSTGEVSPVGAGTAHVIATWASDGTYCEKVMNSSDFTVSGNVTVTFKKNGGTGTDDQTQSIPYNTATNLKTISTLGLTAPSCKYFYGWATSQSNADAGTRTYTDGQSVTLEEGVTLYAIWKTTQYTVSDGTLSGVGSHSYSSTSIDCGTTLTITCAADASHKGNPTVTATGTHGTISVVSATSVTIANVQSDMAVSISYAAKENYTITWKVAGSALTGAAIASCTNNVLEGGSITALPSAPADNTLSACSANKFMGWAKLNADVTTPITDADDIAALDLFTTVAGAPDITDNTTFYAVFANSTSGTWNMGTITTIEKGATMSYANCNGSHTVAGDDGNNYSYTSYQIMSSSGNQFQSGAGYMYNTTPFPGITKIYFDGANSNTSYLSVYEADTIIYGTPGKLVAIAGTAKDYGYDYEYTLSGKSYFLLKAGSATIKANDITVTFGSATNYVTKCCTPLDDINGDKTDLVYNGVKLTWDDISHVSSWRVTGKEKSSGTAVAAGNIGTPSDDGDTYSCEISNLKQYTDYVFKIKATAATGYCDDSVEVEFKTPCVAPSSLSITATNSKWDYCAGESMTLTIDGTNINTAGGATYQWKKWNGSSWDAISGATSASYSVASMAAANAGQYCCTVTNPGSSCDATSSGVWVRVWQLHLGDDDIDFTNTGTGTGNNTAVHLDADTHYEFKLKDNNGGWFGLNSKTVTATISAFALNGSGANVNVTSGLEGDYTFAINYSTPTAPTIAITYPTANQTAGYPVYFDKSVITGWNTAGADDIFLRIGKSNQNKNNTTDSKTWTLVPGTDKFYKTVTLAYTGFEAWQIANNTSWSGDNSIYLVNGSGYAITKATNFQKYVVGESGVTIVPTTSNNTSDGCNYWNVDKSEGMLTHTATISSYSNGTVTVAYTKYDGTGAASFTSGSNDDLAHRCILTITATPNTGYNLTSLQVNSSDFTSGENHILSADATITAVFTAQTSTVKLKPNGGSGSDQTVTATYDAAMPSTLSGGGAIVKPSRDHYSFTGYFDNTSGGTQYYTNTLASAKTWDKTGAQNLYAQWQGDSYTITFKDKGNNAYSGSNSGSLPTSHTYGTATVLVDGVKTGYHFDGWYTDASCTAGNEITSIGATAITANTTYYAKWTIENYSVTWKVNGSNYTTGTPSSIADYNTKVSKLPTAPSAPEGCSDKVFKGWSVSNLGKATGQSAPADLFTTADGSPAITAATTFYAVFADETPERSETTWTKTSNTSDLTTGTYAILTYQFKAFTGSISSGHGGQTSSAFSFTDNVATSAPDGMQEVTITRVAANQFTISRVIDVEDVPTTQYLHATKCGSGGLAWDTGTGANYWYNNSTGHGIRYSVQYKFSNKDTNPYMLSTTNDPSFRTSGNDGSYYLWFAKKGSVVTPASWSNYVTECDEPEECGTPTFSVDEGTYTETQTVTISTVTDGATIRYTTDGTDPTSSSGTVYSEPVEISCTTTLKAIAYKANRDDSEVGSVAITIKVPNPTFSINSGTYYSVQNVTLADAMDGAKIYYTTTSDGTDPTTPTSSSTEYTGAINIPANSTIKVSAIAIKDGCATASDVVTKTYVVRVGTNYTLVTDVNDLNEGDKIVIVADNGNTKNAINTYAAGNDRPSTNDFDFANNDKTVVTVYPLKVGDSYTVQVIDLQGEPGAWVLKAGTNYLGLKADNNYLKSYVDNTTDETKWSISISTGIAHITNNQYTSRYIEYNSSGSKFACYSSNQTARTKIYSVPNPNPLIKVEGTLSAFTGCTSEASAAQSFYVSGKNLSADIKVTAPDGYEVSLSSDIGYAGYIDVERTGTAVAKTQVYVRLKAGDAGAVAAANVVVSVEANSLSQNVAIPASTIAAADTYIDRMHGAEPTNECGSYSAPVLDDGDMETGTDCQKNYAIFQGWVAEDDINLDGTLKAGATIVAGGASKTASGTTYYSIWEAVDE